MIAIPEDFAAGIVNLAGGPGQTWLDGLPGLLDSLCLRWSLAVDGEPMHGYLGLVVPVRRRGEPGVLKVSWPDASTRHELSALTVWNGNGAVRVLEADRDIGAMVLERVDGRHSLEVVEIGEAVTIASRLLRRLAVPAPADLPHLSTAAAEMSRTFYERWERLNRPIPRRFVDAAGALATQLGPASDSLVANYDLHYGNVLAGEREPWLAIDPKVVAGDPEYAPAQLLWTRLEDMHDARGLGHYFDQLVGEAALNLQLTRSWSVVRCVDYWLWALSIGLTEDPLKCAAIVAWLDP